MSPETQILLASLAACRQRTAKLKFSLDKNQHLFPIYSNFSGDRNLSSWERIDLTEVA
jgi:hypothetical protein